MEKIKSTKQLREAIQALELKQANDARLFKEQCKATYEGLNPLHWIKNKIMSVAHTPDLKMMLLDTSLGLLAGYLSKKATVGSSDHPFRQFLGSLVQIGVTNTVLKNSEDIKSAVLSFVNGIFGKKDGENTNG